MENEYQPQNVEISCIIPIWSNFFIVSFTVLHWRDFIEDCSWTMNCKYHSLNLTFLSWMNYQTNEIMNAVIPSLYSMIRDLFSCSFHLVWSFLILYYVHHMYSIFKLTPLSHWDNQYHGNRWSHWIYKFLSRYTEWHYYKFWLVILSSNAVRLWWNSILR